MTSSLSFAFLKTVRQLAFAASSGRGSQMQWNHHGTGTVQVTEDGCDLHFAESFTLENGTVCQDRKCWRFTGHGITFLHWRQQRYQEILHFPHVDRSPTPVKTIMACAPYLCPPDHYHGSLQDPGDGTLLLSLHITGPRKNEHIRYTYRNSLPGQTGIR